MNINEFEKRLFEMRKNYYRYPKVDIIKSGFRPISGIPADFCVIEDNYGNFHFFYIERRLLEGTPFYPGNEIYFGHAITKDFINWTVENPVMLVKPDNPWEEAHVWAPSIIKYNDQYIMAYTGCDYNMCQNIGLASSKDLFNWKRWDSNPISPCKDKVWASWSEDHISSCRDPHLFVHNNQFYMTYSANTKDGSSCIALCSSKDLYLWEDYGPILVGPNEGYYPDINGKHSQGSIESSNLTQKNGIWYLMFQFKFSYNSITNWVIESKNMFSFDLYSAREFWPGAYTVEIVKNKGSKSLLACTSPIKFGEVDWSDDCPIAKFLLSEEQLYYWSK